MATHRASDLELEASWTVIRLALPLPAFSHSTSPSTAVSPLRVGDLPLPKPRIHSGSLRFDSLALVHLHFWTMAHIWTIQFILVAWSPPKQKATRKSPSQTCVSPQKQNSELAHLLHINLDCLIPVQLADGFFSDEIYWTVSNAHLMAS